MIFGQLKLLPPMINSTSSGFKRAMDIRGKRHAGYDCWRIWLHIERDSIFLPRAYTGVHKITLLHRIALPKFLTLDTFSFFSMDMRQNEI
jgi:hypothetical protein